LVAPDAIRRAIIALASPLLPSPLTATSGGNRDSAIRSAEANSRARSGRRAGSGELPRSRLPENRARALRRSRGNAAQAARLLGEVGRGVARDPGGTLRAMRRLRR